MQTVSQLIEALKEFPKDAEIYVCGPDNGYDWTYCKNFTISLDKGFVWLEGTEGEAET